MNFYPPSYSVDFVTFYFILFYFILLYLTIQSEEGMHQAAARNYHTATVYFRVLESMVPRLTSRVHASLNYAACRTQQSSHLLENLVHEHFEGLRYLQSFFSCLWDGSPWTDIKISQSWMDTSIET